MNGTARAKRICDIIDDMEQAFPMKDDTKEWLRFISLTRGKLNDVESRVNKQIEKNKTKPARLGKKGVASLQEAMNNGGKV